MGHGLSVTGARGTSIGKVKGMRTRGPIGGSLARSEQRYVDWIAKPPNRSAVVMLQGMAFSLAERQALGIHGLLPPRFKTQEEQLELCKVNIDRYTDPLNKYIYLTGLQVS